MRRCALTETSVIVGPPRSRLLKARTRERGLEMFGHRRRARKLPPGALSVEEKDNYGEN
jgi:hypothetical protein